MSIDSKRTKLKLLLAVPLVAISSISVQADLSDADYQAALQVAQKKVARKKSLQSQSGSALSSSLIRNLFGRTYRVGDRWDVAALSLDHATARMTGETSRLESKSGRVAVFRYEVVRVKNPPEAEVEIQVTQLEDFGFKKADPRVQSLKLFMNDRMLQSRKTYVMTDRSGQLRSVSVSPDAMHSTLTGLELFPLDVPELLTAESKRPESTPGLPERLQVVASQVSHRIELSKSLLFKQDDFFGREIEAIWQSGDPWPSYFKTSNGISILIRKGASS